MAVKFFHDEEDGPAEPVHGMPELLPEGEKLLWQGRPSAVALAFGAFRLRWVIGYFVAMTLYRLANLSTVDAGPEQMTGVLTSSVLFGVAAIALVFALSYAMSRAAVFTITTERVILRYGAAIRKYVNLPLSKMQGAQLKRRSVRVGDISLQLEDGPGQPPYLHLWPFARPFKFSKPQPMLRGIKDPERVAQMLARAAFERAPDTVRLELDTIPSKRPAGAPSKASVPAI